MAAALFSLFFPETNRLSAGLTVCWIGLRALRQLEHLPWSWGVLAILLLNIRGLVLDDGSQPVSHMDYVLATIAFLVAFNRPAQAWRRTAAVCCLAFAAGTLVNFEIIWDFLQAGVEYQLDVLSKNQTALLAAWASSCGLMAMCLNRRRRSWLVLAPATVLCLIVAMATTSRAAVAIIPVAFAVAGLISFRQPLASRLRRLDQRLLGSRRSLRFAIIAAGLTAAGLIAASLLGRLGDLLRHYGQENLANDLGRLKVYACYASLPFKGANRFIYGVGYQNSWQKWCTPDVIGVKLTHAHNLFLQIWGDTGVIPSVFLILCLALAVRQILRNSTRLSWRLSLPTTAMMLVLVGFNSVELGMVKVPFLMAAFGTFLASIYMGDSTDRTEHGADRVNLNPGQT